MTNSKSYLTIIFVFLLSLSLNLQAYAFDKEKLGFSSNAEFMVYDLKKFGFKIGKARLNILGLTEINEEKLFHIQFVATAYNAYEEENAFLDPESFYPKRIERDINIWGKKEFIVEEYSESNNSVKITKTINNKTKSQVIEKDQKFGNIYGFIERYRQQVEFEAGEQFDVHLPAADLSFESFKDDELKVRETQVPAISLESIPSKYQIWFDTSPKKIPVQIDGVFSFGKISMTIKEYDRQSFESML